MHRDDILTLLEKLGYGDIVVKDQNFSHPADRAFLSWRAKRMRLRNRDMHAQERSTPRYFG